MPILPDVRAGRARIHPAFRPGRANACRRIWQRLSKGRFPRRSLPLSIVSGDVSFRSSLTTRADMKAPRTMDTLLDVARRSEWDEFLTASRPEIGFKQTTWWAEYRRVAGWRHFGVVVRDGSAIVGG